MVGRGAASFRRAVAAGRAVCKCICFTYRQSEPTLEEFLCDLRERGAPRRRLKIELRQPSRKRIADLGRLGSHESDHDLIGHK